MVVIIVAANPGTSYVVTGEWGRWGKPEQEGPRGVKTTDCFATERFL